MFHNLFVDGKGMVQDMREIVTVNSVEKNYGNTQVIRHCSFQIREGEIYGLLGVNGAGKTTLMKMILGLQKVDGGNILVLGTEIGSGTEYLSEVGSVIESPSFYGHLSGEEVLSMHLSYMRKQGDIPGVLRLVGLWQAGAKPVSKYSLGMKQRLGIARAIIHRPKLLILDEPFNGLDPVVITEMRGLLRRMAEEGMAVLFSSHIIGEVRHMADRVGILSGGSVRQEFLAEEKAAEYGEQFEAYVVSLMKGE